MVKFGTAPYLECSSAGDKRFSAFHARILSRGNKSIEEIYQASKVFDDGTTNLHWRDAKGRMASNQHDCSVLYDQLWNEYLTENPELVSVILNASGLSDVYGQPGHCCQADTLWRIRRSILTSIKHYRDQAFNELFDN